MKDYELERLFKRRSPFSEKGLKEDQSMLQPDGTRACANWELAGKGFHAVNMDEDPYQVGMDEPIPENLRKEYAKLGIE